jgi:DNA-binding NarL/FixJ family response regulator
MPDRGRADLLADLRRELLEHEARIKTLVELLLHDGPQPAPSASTVRRAPAATADDQIPLTEREAQVLHLLVKGRTNRQIGAELHLVGSTVRNYLRPIYQKLGVTRRTQAAVRAFELGLVTRVEPDRHYGSERRPPARSPPVAAAGLVSVSQLGSGRRACRLSVHRGRRSN